MGFVFNKTIQIRDLYFTRRKEKLRTNSGKWTVAYV